MFLASSMAFFLYFSLFSVINSFKLICFNMLPETLYAKVLPIKVKTGSPTLKASTAVACALYGKVSRNKSPSFIILRCSSYGKCFKKISLF